MKKHLASLPLLSAVVLALSASAALAAAETPVPGNPGYTNTPFLPNSKWRVHDAFRPRPPVVQPAGLTLPITPPSDAVVLFDGKDLANWVGDSTNPVAWKVENGYMEVGGKGGIKSKAEFGDMQLHVEFATPAEVKGDSQGRGNSGIFLMGLYEVQVLDSYNNPTYADGQLGAVYGQHPPMANPAKAPGEWQSYDVLFEAPKFSGDGKLEKPAYVTVIINGVCLQNHAEIIGRGTHQKVATYAPHAPTGPIALQNHNNPMRFRNIWVRELKQAE